MFEQMEESVDRCWAYNKAGQRCELVAGHDRDHSVIIAWTAAECWTPGTMVEVTLKEYGTPNFTAPEPKAHNSRCIVCDHPMHRGQCGVKDGGFECDCAEGVE